MLFEKGRLHGLTHRKQERDDAEMESRAGYGAAPGQKGRSGSCGASGRERCIWQGEADLPTILEGNPFDGARNELLVVVLKRD